MDDERVRLVSALRTRLTDLDAKVVAYRRNQADEFRRYAANLLNAVAADVAADVAETINSGAKEAREVSDNSIDSSSTGHAHYAALYPGFLRDGETADVVLLSATPPPVLPDPSPPRSRNDDFRGVFTPPFLPLLDGSTHNRPARSLSDPVAATARTDTAAAATPSLSFPPLPAKETEPEEQPRLKGALRRPSRSLSSRSPAESRRVRFAFDGREVLPTSPPQIDHVQDFSWLLPNYHTSGFGNGGAFEEIDLSRHSDNTGRNNTKESSSLQPKDPGIATAFVGLHASTRSPAGGEHDHVFLSAGNDSQQQQRQQQQTELPAGDRLSLGSSSDGSGLESHRRRHSLVLDDDELEPIPLTRRISSSDRLRALSKVPIEDPSTWTVVDPQSDPADVKLDASTFVSQPTKAEDHNSHNHNRGSDGSDRSIADSSISMRSPWEKTRLKEAADVANSPAAPLSSPSVVLSKSPPEPTVEEPSPAENGTVVAPITAASTAAYESATTTPPVQNPAIATSEEHSTLQPKKLAPQIEVELAEEDDFFEFEHDIGGGNDDAVGYPLARVSSVRPYINDDDSDADDAETALAEAGGLDEEEARLDEESGKLDEEASGLDEKADELPATMEETKEEAGGVDDADQMNGASTKAELLQGLPTVVANHRQMMPRDVSQSLTRASQNRTSYSQNQKHGQNISLSLGSAHGAASSRFGRAGMAMSPSTMLAMPTSPTSPTTPTSPTFAASVGSYRGRSISMFNVVKDPRILQEVAQLGDFNSFVGGVDGRTGVDGVDDVVGSFATRDPFNSNSMGLSGTPRSLSERMAMEDSFRGRR
ncbi:hypothetical protein CMQ_5792 [Grosmannia clavigera kw1407]|uniref:Uncharacterized protein n=1 Tax=Grosmannia clavigera (strain kw1407 / UAMH 11150) TaxID=655863 RepID=F0XSG9_GROCL|nr:uncharacterized protein CMQ_5792 [Grosmannia clavigera kw1407]EFW99371.1 hypothetical protein CMQ_5792 [Grosmannia clavigera kw1407]